MAYAASVFRVGMDRRLFDCTDEDKAESFAVLINLLVLYTFLESSYHSRWERLRNNTSSCTFKQLARGGQGLKLGDVAVEPVRGSAPR